MIGRRREFADIGHLLDRAAAGSGGLLVILGAAGSGRTTLADAAAGLGRRRGFDVARASVTGAGSGLLVWAQVVGDLGDPDHFADRLLAGVGSLELDQVGRWLASGSERLIVVDDIDRAGPAAINSCRSSVLGWPAGGRRWWRPPVFRWGWLRNCGWAV